MDKQREAHYRELERRRHLEESCKPSKVRTYACNENGERTIKYFSYHYDFEEDKCVEKVKKVVSRCESIREENEGSDNNSEDNEDDREERFISRRSKHGKFTKADDFNDKTLGMH